MYPLSIGIFKTYVRLFTKGLQLPPSVYTSSIENAVFFLQSMPRYVVIMTVHNLLSRVQLIISETNIPRCHEATVFSIVSLGLHLPLFPFNLPVDKFSPSQHTTKECRLPAPDAGNKFFLSISLFKDIWITPFVCPWFSHHSSVRRNLCSVVVLKQ